MTIESLAVSVFLSVVIILALITKILSQWKEINALIKEVNYWTDCYDVSKAEMSRMDAELRACWKCINLRSNKGHWEKQKRVNGKFAK